MEKAAEKATEKAATPVERLKAAFKDRAEVPASELQADLNIESAEEFEKLVRESRIFEFSPSENNKRSVQKKQIVRLKLLLLTSEEEVTKPINEILPTFEQLFTHVPYIRFNKNLGHVVVFEEDFLANKHLIGQSIEVEAEGAEGKGKVAIAIKEPSFDDRRHFSAEHSRHMEGILRSRYAKRIHFAVDGLASPKSGIFLGPQKFKSLKEVKSVMGKLLKSAKVGEAIENPEAVFLKELLKFHERADEKLADFDHFEVGMHPEHNETRCFLVVKSDGRKEDFSFNKCIKQISALISG